MDIIKFINKYKDKILEDSLSFFIGIFFVFAMSIVFSITFIPFIIIIIFYTTINLHIIHKLLNKTKFTKTQKFFLGIIFYLNFIFISIPKYILFKTISEPFDKHELNFYLPKINVFYLWISDKIKYIPRTINNYLQEIILAKYYFEW